MSERFDDLARDLAGEAPVGRRSMLGRMAAALLGGGAIVVGGADRAGARPPRGITCPPGMAACGSVCRDVNIDPDSCGACGTVCAPDEVCRNGTCQPLPCTCAQPCPPGTTSCGGVCVDTSNDLSHCGACGTACGAGEFCSNGTCAPNPCLGPDPCPGGCVSSNCDPATGWSCSPDDAACAPDGICTNAGICEPLCTPTTCAAVGAECGVIADGCGGTRDCGPCRSGQVCGGGGLPNVCG